MRPGLGRLPRISPIAWLAWFVVSLSVFGALETVALFNHHPDDTLTRTIVHVVPWPVALGVWILAAGLALWHWAVEYRRRHGA